MKTKKLSFVLSLVMGMSMLASVPASAANSSDTVYNFENKSVGWVYFTEYRAKENTSGTYVYYVEGQSGGTYFSVWSNSGNETKNDSAIIYPKQKRKISQYVYEKGKRSCCLGVSPKGSYAKKIAGLWSPDSVGSYPYAN